MPEFKGTEGNWIVKEYKDDDIIAIEHQNDDMFQKSLATISPSASLYEKALCNAKLMAAAPELLEALKVALQYVDITDSYEEIEIDGEMLPRMEIYSIINYAIQLVD